MLRPTLVCVQSAHHFEAQAHWKGRLARRRPRTNASVTGRSRKRGGRESCAAQLTTRRHRANASAPSRSCSATRTTRSRPTERSGPAGRLRKGPSHADLLAEQLSAVQGSNGRSGSLLGLKLNQAIPLRNITAAATVRVPFADEGPCPLQRPRAALGPSSRWIASPIHTANAPVHPLTLESPDSRSRLTVTPSTWPCSPNISMRSSSAASSWTPDTNKTHPSTDLHGATVARSVTGPGREAAAAATPESASMAASLHTCCGFPRRQLLNTRKCAQLSAACVPGSRGHGPAVVRRRPLQAEPPVPPSCRPRGVPQAGDGRASAWLRQDPGQLPRRVSLCAVQCALPSAHCQVSQPLPPGAFLPPQDQPLPFAQRAGLAASVTAPTTAGACVVAANWARRASGGAPSEACARCPVCPPPSPAQPKAPVPDPATRCAPARVLPRRSCLSATRARRYRCRH